MIIKPDRCMTRAGPRGERDCWRKVKKQEKYSIFIYGILTILELQRPEKSEYTFRPRKPNLEITKITNEPRHVISNNVAF